MSWQVAEEARRPAAESPAPDPPPEPDGAGGRRRGWPLALLAGLVLLGLLAWMGRGARVAREAREQLLAELSRELAAEAGAQLTGEVAAAEAWLDPEAPREWAGRYRRLFVPRHLNPYNEFCGAYDIAWRPTAAAPRLALRGVSDGPAGRRAVLGLAWAEGSRATELRAYREWGGGWRRTPLSEAELGRGARQERALGALRLSGPSGDLAALTDPEGLALDFAALDERLRRELPEITGRDGALAAVDLVVRPTELEAPVLELGIAPERQLVLNSPALALVNPEGPLTAAAQVRLAVVTAVVDARFSQLGARQLPFGPEWALGAGERLALRNHLRRSLAGAWRSQLARPDPPDAAVGQRFDDYAEWQRRCLSDSLLVQQLLVADPGRSLGSLVARLRAAPDAEDALLALSGQPDRGAYEAWARAWALTMER